MLPGLERGRQLGRKNETLIDGDIIKLPSIDTVVKEEPKCHHGPILKHSRHLLSILHHVSNALDVVYYSIAHIIIMTGYA